MTLSVAMNRTTGSSLAAGFLARALIARRWLVSSVP